MKGLCRRQVQKWKRKGGAIDFKFQLSEGWTLFYIVQWILLLGQESEFFFKKNVVGGEYGGRGKWQLGKREVVRGLCKLLWAKRKEIFALLSLRVTRFALRRRELQGTLLSLKIILRHLFWAASILSDKSLEMPWMPNRTSVFEGKTYKKEKNPQTMWFRTFNLLGSLRRENAVFVRFKKFINVAIPF